MNSCENFTWKLPTQNGLICLFLFSFICFFNKDVSRLYSIGFWMVIILSWKKCGKKPPWNNSSIPTPFEQTEKNQDNSPVCLSQIRSGEHSNTNSIYRWDKISLCFPVGRAEFLTEYKRHECLRQKRSSICFDGLCRMQLYLQTPLHITW